jgi:hypothetical protein
MTSTLIFQKQCLYSRSNMFLLVHSKVNTRTIKAGGISEFLFIRLFLIFSWLNLSSTSVCRIPLNIFCSAGLVAMNAFHFCLSWKFLIFTSIVKDSFVGYSNVGSYFLLEVEIHHSMLSLLLEFLLRNVLLF